MLAGGPFTTSLPGKPEAHLCILHIYVITRASLVAQLVKNLPAIGFDPWAGKIPWRRKRLPTPVFWPGEFHGLYSSYSRKELDMIEQLSLLLHFDVITQT